MPDAPEDVEDPLFELVSDLRSVGAAAPAWLARHAPDGELGPVWRACENPSTLLLVGELLYPRRLLTTAACACARTVIDLLPTTEERSLRALEVAEAWTRGEVSDDLTFASMTSACDARDAAQHARGPVREATDAVAWAAQASDVSSAYANHAGHAALHAAAARVATGRTTRERSLLFTQALRELSNIVRKYLSCPSLEALTAAARASSHS